jgi:signal transduction histidine kinase
MSAFRTVGARLSLALLAVVAIALGLVYLVVVPPLKSRLINSKLNELQHAAPRLVSGYRKAPITLDFLSTAADSINSRVLLMEVFARNPWTVIPTETSLQGQNARPYYNDPIALRAAQTLRLARGTVTHGEDRFAEVAVPVTQTGEVLLLSAPLHDALADVQAVQRRLLLAGGLALAVALLIGYGAARFFARRIRRLERAADRIAGGYFDDAVADPSLDELGELSRAFDRMRVKLAGLEHARREFVANASHELRTPLFSLSGFLELLEDEELDEPTRREFLETMADQVRRLTKLTEDLLDLSRLDAGRLHVKSEDLDLAGLTAAAVDEFAGVARSTGHVLAFVGNGAAAARGDEQRVLQIVRILVENALVHTPPGTPVRVFASRLDGEVEVRIEDDGPGIRDDDRAALFERFYRGNGTKASGSGLGLAIARELAELMGGRIALDSRPGRTIVSLVLPAGGSRSPAGV